MVDKNCYDISVNGTQTSFGKYFVRIVLLNGTHVNIGENSNLTSQLMDIDINGSKAPNKYGIDQFRFQSDKRLFGYQYSPSVAAEEWTADFRAAAKKACETYPKSCSALIISDGWKIPDDYPVKL
ncbi:MAG: hypothetical protein LBK53_03685 [Heliobacteriaceae bacterium]|jgi:hypothetical protein|nr:hypothetical protein [Heliobacteriaceae bacterium]